MEEPVSAWIALLSSSVAVTAAYFLNRQMTHWVRRRDDQRPAWIEFLKVNARAMEVLRGHEVQQGTSDKDRLSASRSELQDLYTQLNVSRSQIDLLSPSELRHHAHEMQKGLEQAIKATSEDPDSIPQIMRWVAHHRGRFVQAARAYLPVENNRRTRRRHRVAKEETMELADLFEDQPAEHPRGPEVVEIYERLRRPGESPRPELYRRSTRTEREHVLPFEAVRAYFSMPLVRVDVPSDSGTKMEEARVGVRIFTSIDETSHWFAPWYKQGTVLWTSWRDPASTPLRFSDIRDLCPTSPSEPGHFSKIRELERTMTSTDEPVSIVVSTVRLKDGGRLVIDGNHRLGALHILKPGQEMVILELSLGFADGERLGIPDLNHHRGSTIGI